MIPVIVSIILFTSLHPCGIMSLEVDSVASRRKPRELDPVPDPQGSVRYPLFLSNPFFNANDKAQVKYEMLRSVMTNELSVTDAVDAFGLTKPVFYKAQRAFSNQGILGLTDKKRGPKGPSKVTNEVRDFILDSIRQHPRPTYQEVSELIESVFNTHVSLSTIRKIVSDAGLSRRRPSQS
jgi:transposase